MPTVSRGPVPLDKYRVSHLTNFVKHFFGLFSSFFYFCRLAAEWGGVVVAGYLLAISTPRYARRRVAHGVAAGGGWRRRVAHGVAGRAAGGRQGGRQGGAFGRPARFARKSRPYICADTSRSPHPYWTGPPYFSRKVLTNFLLYCTVSTTFPNGGVQDAETYRHI